MPGPDGKTLMHAELKIGDSRLFLVDEWLFFVDEFPEMQCRGPQSVGGTPVTIHMYVEDVDAAFKRAVAAGAQVRMPLEDMFWAIDTVSLLIHLGMPGPWPRTRRI